MLRNILKMGPKPISSASPAPNISDSFMNFKHDVKSQKNEVNEPPAAVHKYTMNEKIKIPYPIIVEGKYDKIKLASIVEATVITCEGFGIFKNAEKRALLKTLSQKSELIVLADSDSAGSLIRSHLSGIVPKERLINLYTPQHKGKEKRKREPSKEGYLGVEGTDAEILRALLAPFGIGELPPKRGSITKTDFYEYGLSGGADSKLRRDKLAKRLSLPLGMTANAMLEAVNIICTREEFEAALVPKNNSDINE